jgi:hypothetical protein
MTTYILSDIDAENYRTLSCDGAVIVKANFDNKLGVTALQLLLGAIAQSTQTVVVNEDGNVLIGDVRQLA